jgi:hypothetical protein
VKSDRRKTQDGIIRQIEILPSENTLLITSNLNNETEHLKIGPDTGPDIKKKGKKDTQPEKTGPKKINIPDNQDENTGPKEKISTVDVSSYVKPEQEFTPTKNFQIDFYNLDPVLKRIVNSEYFQLPKESRPALEQFYNKWKLQPESIELISTLS